MSEGASIVISFDEQLSEDDEKAGAANKTVATWLLSESWWAGSFRPASYRQTALWAIGVGSWVIASQLEAAARRTAEQYAPGWLVMLAKVFLYTAAGLGAALITPLALLLMIVGILPIPGLRDLTLERSATSPARTATCRFSYGARSALRRCGQPSRATSSGYQNTAIKSLSSRTRRVPRSVGWRSGGGPTGFWQLTKERRSSWRLRRISWTPRTARSMRLRLPRAIPSGTNPSSRSRSPSS